MLQGRLESNGSTFLLRLESLFGRWGRASVTSHRWWTIKHRFCNSRPFPDTICAEKRLAGAGKGGWDGRGEW